MPESTEPGKDGREEVIRASSQYVGHGLAFAASVALFGWVGSKLGDWIGAKSVLTLLGMMLGGAAGFYWMYLQLVVRPREEEERGPDRDT